VTGDVVLVGALVAVAIVALIAAARIRQDDRRGGSGDGPGAPREEAAAELLRSIADSANLLLARYGADGRLLSISPSVLRFVGVPAAEFVAGRRNIAEFVHPADLTAFERAAAARRHGDAATLEFQYRLRGTDGAWRWLHERQRRVDGAGPGGRSAWEAVAVDYTDRRLAEERQRKRLEQQLLATRILEAFLQADDLAATIREILATVGSAFDVSRASFLLAEPDRQRIALAEEWCVPGVESAEDRRKELPEEIVRWWFDAARAGRPMILRRGEGPEHDLLVASRMPEEVQSALVLPIRVNTVLRGVVAIEDLRSPRPWEPEEIATMQTLAFAISRAIEQQDAAEERARLAALQRQLERSEMVAQLAGGLTHDFNNVLFALSGHVQLLRQKAPPGEFRNAVDELDKVVAGANDLAGGILRAHRGDTSPPGPLAVGPEIEAATRLVTRLLPRTLHVESAVAADGPLLVRSTPQNLQQLVLNLIVNARDAVGGRGRVQISVRKVEDDQLGSIAMVTVEDDGPGVPDELLAQIVRPFFTTKGDTGTGLGLSICRRVAGEAGGRLDLDRSPTLGGLRVRVCLPLCDDDGAPLRAADDPSAAAAEGTERLAEVARVLIVEDDVAVREVLTRAFDELDIDVVARPDAMGVEELVTAGPLPFDLLVFDIDLPGLSGIDCLDRLRQRGVRLPCLFVTGGPSEPAPNLAPARVLRKPFRLDSLMAACRAVLADAVAARDR
jgi:PAS domain S-box-containing protein